MALPVEEQAIFVGKNGGPRSAQLQGPFVSLAQAQYGNWLTATSTWFDQNPRMGLKLDKAIVFLTWVRRTSINVVLCHRGTDWR